MSDNQSKTAPTVFLSHAHEDAELAQRVVNRLTARGVSVWSDLPLLTSGDQWEERLRGALSASDAVLVLVTPSSVESHWVTQEWSEAMRQSRRVIPAYAGGLRPSNLSPLLAARLGITLTEPDFVELDRVLSDLEEIDSETNSPLLDVLDIERIVATVTTQALERVERQMSAPDDEDQASSDVFVIMSFSADMDPTFEAIQSAASTVGLKAQRVKDVPGDYRITDQVLAMLRTARFVVADLTHDRPNVYFELGYARGTGKTVITILRTGTDPHFDVRDWTYLEYADSRPLERSLVERFRYELGKG